MEAARREIDETTLDTARGTIGGVLTALVLAALAVGINNIDDLAGIPLAIYIAAFGIAGYFLVKR